MPVTIQIKRDRGQNARPGLRAPGWVYSYSTPVDVDWGNSDGTTRPGPRAGEFITYGSGLGSLRDMLRRKHGRDVILVQTWET